MTTHATPPETAGPHLPLNNPYPPAPGHAPGQVFLSPVPVDAAPPKASITKEAPTTADLTHTQQAITRIRRGASHLWDHGKKWALLKDVDDETLHNEVLRRRREEVAAERHRHAADMKAIRSQLRQEARAGHPGRADHYAQTLGTLAATRPEQVTDEDVTSREIVRHRMGKVATNCAIVAAGAYAGITVVPQSPLLLLASIPAILGTLWHFGRESEPDGDKESSPVVVAADAPGIPAPAPSATTGAPVILSADSIPDDADRTPYPISRARTIHEAADCLLRAFQAKRLAVGEISTVERHSWGWQMTVRVTDGTPAAIIAAAGDLETYLDLPTGGFVPQPMAERRACAIVRLVMSDPFAQAPALPYRAPKSMSIRDKARLGTSIGGDPLDFSVAGVMGVVVAASGGGKTGLLQAIGEMTTACRDCITIDLDPHGDGLEDLHDAVRLTGRSHQQIESALLFFLMLSKGRARLRGTLGMGKKWEPSAANPVFVVVIDEYPKLSALAKQLAFELLLVGRKEGVWVIFAAQGGTKLYLGENIAPMVALKVVGPCKVGDTRAVFGDGSVGEGWLPHRLSPATDTDPKDAGHIYLQGIPGRADEPIEYKVHEAPAAVLRKLAAERREAGLLDPDAGSLAAMTTVDLPDFVEPVFDIEGNLKKEAPVDLLTWERLLKLCDGEPPAPALMSKESKAGAAAVIDALAVMDHGEVDRMRTERLVEALRAYNPEVYADLTPDRLRSLLREGGVGSPVTLGALDGLSNPRGYKREALDAAT